MTEKLRRYKDEVIVAIMFLPLYIYMFWCCLPIDEDIDLERILYLTFTYFTGALALGECSKRVDKSNKKECLSSNMFLVVKTLMFISAYASLYEAII